MLIKIEIKKKFYLPSDGSAEAGRRRREGGVADVNARTYIHKQMKCYIMFHT